MSGNSNFTVSRPIPSSVGTCMYWKNIAATPTTAATAKIVSWMRTKRVSISRLPGQRAQGNSGPELGPEPGTMRAPRAEV